MPSTDESFGPIGKIPDIAGPIAAWRWWNIDDTGGLHSVSMNQSEPWPEAGLVAQCIQSCGYGPYGPIVRSAGTVHKSPSTEGEHLGGYGCGIYAMKLLIDVFRYHWGGWCLGRVELGGRVMEHEHGWRAEKAHPLTICDGMHNQSIQDGKTFVNGKEIVSHYRTLIQLASARYSVPLIPWPVVAQDAGQRRFH